MRQAQATVLSASQCQTRVDEVLDTAAPALLTGTARDELFTRGTVEHREQVQHVVGIGMERPDERLMRAWRF